MRHPSLWGRYRRRIRGPLSWRRGAPGRTPRHHNPDDVCARSHYVAERYPVGLSTVGTLPVRRFPVLAPGRCTALPRSVSSSSAAQRPHDRTRFRGNRSRDARLLEFSSATARNDWILSGLPVLQTFLVCRSCRSRPASSTAKRIPHPPRRHPRPVLHSASGIRLPHARGTGARCHPLPASTPAVVRHRIRSRAGTTRCRGMACRVGNLEAFRAVSRAHRSEQRV